MAAHKYKFSHHLASMNASVESMADHSDAIELADQLREVDAIEREIDREQEKVATLENLIATLESHDRPLTPFQVQMLGIASAKVGVPLPHQQLGYGMEAYTGLRFRAMRNIALEGFKDAVKKVIDYIVELFGKLKAWLKKVFHVRHARIRQMRDLLSVAKWTGGRVFGSKQMDIEMLQSLVLCYTVNGTFQPNKVLANLEETLKDLSQGQFQTAIQAYPGQAGAVIDEFLKDHAGDDANWRRHVEKVNALSVPAPHGFTAGAVNLSVQEFESLPLLAGVKLGFTAVSQGNDHGAKGAKSHAEALAKVGRVRLVDVQHQVPKAMQMLQTLKQLGNAGARGLTKDVLSILDHADMLLQYGDKMAEHGEQEMKRIQAEMHSGRAHEMHEDANGIVTNLSRSAGAVGKMAADLAKEGSEMAIKVGATFVNLMMYNLDKLDEFNASLHDSMGDFGSHLDEVFREAYRKGGQGHHA